MGASVGNCRDRFVCNISLVLLISVVLASIPAAVQGRGSTDLDREDYRFYLPSGSGADILNSQAVPSLSLTVDEKGITEIAKAGDQPDGSKELSSPSQDLLQQYSPRSLYVTPTPVPCTMPQEPYGPNPQNGASGVSVQANLNWYSGVTAMERFSQMAPPKDQKRTSEECAQIAKQIAGQPQAGQRGEPTVGAYPLTAFENRPDAAVEILMFVGHSDNSFGGEVENTVNAIAQYFTDFSITQTVSETDYLIEAELVGKDVFLMPEQESWYTSGMGQFGANLNLVLNNFIASGGIVIVCDHYPQGGASAFLSGAGLMNSVWQNSTGDLLAQVVGSHPITGGVSSPFTAMNGSVTYQSVSDGQVVVTDYYGNQPMAAVKDSAGRVVLLGWDYYSYNSDMARMIANAVQLSVDPCLPTYDVYFGPSYPPANLIYDDGFGTTCDPGTLAPLTTYYWQVIATNSAGVAPGPVWSFTTGDEPSSFTELFDTNSNDLDYLTLTFYPTGTSTYYTGCQQSETAYSTDPSGGTPLYLSDDSYTPVFLNSGAQVTLFETPYSMFYVGSNGYLTFNYGDSNLGEGLSSHFSQPRVSALFDDLYPPGGSVSWKQTADRVAVTFQNVPEYGAGGSNNFQIEMFFDGRIAITYLQVDALDGLAGLSQGLGVPVDFTETDLSAMAPCAPDPIVIVHTPLTDTTDLGPYSVCAEITSVTGVCRAELNWSNNGGATYSTAPLVSSGTSSYCAEIPAQVIGNNVCYYLEVEDCVGNIKREPADGGSHCFNVLGVPDLTLSCPALNFTLQPGEIAEVTCTLTNVGTWQTDWAARESRSPSPAPGSSSQVASSRLAINWHAPHESDTLLVKFKSYAATTARTAAHTALGTTRVHSFHLIPVDVVQVPAGAQLQAVAAAYQARPEVEYVEPNYRVKAIGFPDDPQFNSLWGMHNTGQTGGTPDADIDAPEAWDLQTGTQNVIVGVIDTGIDYSHPDLQANLWTNTAELNGTAGMDDDGNGIIDDIYGARWLGGSGLPTSGNPIDGHGHGTHTSGTIGAVGNNGVGVAGVNWSVRIMGLKFLDDSGSGWDADAIAALEYAVDKGANLTSNSWGGGGYMQALKDAIDAAGVAGQLFIAAAGNESRDTDASPNYPSCYDSPNIISVASSDHNDVISWFSNWGATTVDLTAPGSDILSTWTGGGYNTISGTSMATPHVAGVAALLLAQAPGASPATVKQWILDSVDILPGWNGVTLTGGRLNAAKALQEAGLSWLSENPSNGTIVPSQSISIVVRADATGLLDGFTDSGYLGIASDDPSAPPEIPVSISVIDQISIVHTPLTDTTDTGPYSVCADVIARSGILTRVELNWSDNGGASFNTVTMLNTTGDTYCAEIPGQSPGTAICYYIEAEDNMGVVRTNPLGAPGALHCFLVRGIPQLTFSCAPQVDFTVAPGQVQTVTCTLTNTGTWPTDWSLVELPVSASSLVNIHLPEFAGGEKSPSGAYLPEGWVAPSRPASDIQVKTNLAPAGSGANILLLAAGDNPGILAGALAAFPDIDAVDYFDARYGTPVLAETAYDVVVVMSNGPFSNSIAVGDELADYVDAGGTVVQAVASFATGGGWELGGRFTTGGYEPFVHGYPEFFTHTLGAYDPTSSIMEGIVTLTDPLPAGVALSPGAVWVASWDNGTALVATKDGRVVGINVFAFDGGGWTGDVPLLFHNAIVWLQGGNAPWLSESPTSGTLGAGQSAFVQLTADATDLPGGFTDSVLLSIASDDPESPLDVTVTIDVFSCVSIVHTPLGDTSTEDPVTVVANLTAAAGLDTTALWVYYTSDGGSSWNQVAMTYTGAGDTYLAMLPGWPYGTVVSYYILATDLDGCVGKHPYDAPASVHSFRVLPMGLAEDFEPDSSGWSGTGLWHVVSETSYCANYNSPTHSWYYGLESTCTFEETGYSIGSLFTPRFVVPNGASFTFYSWELTECGLCTWDTRKVYIVPEGGVRTEILQCSSNAGAWYPVTPVDLSAYAGQVAQLEFEFNTGDAVANNFPGWYVDDVSVSGAQGPTPTPIETSTPTPTSTSTPTATRTLTPTATMTALPTSTPTNTKTATPSPVPTETPTSFPAAMVHLSPPSIVLHHPPSVASHPSATAEISVNIQDVVDLGAFEFSIGYNPNALLIATTGDVSQGSFLGSTGRTVVPVGPTIDNASGYVNYGAYSLGVPACPSGDGNLARVIWSTKFVSQTTVVPLIIQQVQLGSCLGVTIPATTVQGQITICFFADLDCDNDVDVVDIQQVAGLWNTHAGNPAYDREKDMDKDGDIDIIDIQLVAGRWNAHAPFPPGIASEGVSPEKVVE